MGVLKSYTFPITHEDFASAGFASSSVKRALKELGVDSKIVRMASVAAYEAELNMIIHSHGGEMVLEVEADRLRIICRDKGPGIPDIEQAMQEGYSTASDDIRTMGFGAGMGLPNIKRNSHEFTIKSEVGKGTCIVAEYQLN